MTSGCQRQHDRQQNAPMTMESNRHQRQLEGRHQAADADVPSLLVLFRQPLLTVSVCPATKPTRINFP
jgi:hypothetical protein